MTPKGLVSGEMPDENESAAEAAAETPADEQAEGPMPGDEPESAAEAASETPGDEQAEGLSPEAVRAQTKSKMPPQLQQAYDKVVLAGMKVMFSDETHQQATQMLQGQGPVSQRLGEAITQLMGLLYKESNNTMPPAVIIPAATELLVSAADFLKQSGTEPVSDKDIGDAMSVMLRTLLTKFGQNPDEIEAMINQFDKPEGEEQDAAGGLVQGAMQEPANG